MLLQIDFESYSRQSLQQLHAVDPVDIEIEMIVHVM